MSLRMTEEEYQIFLARQEAKALSGAARQLPQRGSLGETRARALREAPLRRDGDMCLPLEKGRWPEAGGIDRGASGG